MHTQYVDVPHARLAYDEHGEGPTVIVAHGMVRSREIDRRASISAWDSLADHGFRVVAYDARAHGESTGRPVDDDYRWQQLADDLLTLADAVSPNEPVHAVGTSMGTGTILHALTQRPERFRSVALSAPPTAWNTRRPQGRLYASTATRAEQMTSAQFTLAWMSGKPAPIFTGTAIAQPPSVAIDLVPAVFRGCALSDVPTDEALTGIDTPALVLAWATDPAHPLSTAQRLAELLPHASSSTAHDVDAIRRWPGQAAAFFNEHPGSAQR